MLAFQYASPLKSFAIVPFPLSAAVRTTAPPEACQLRAAILAAA
jgi:hypothetical protein